GAASRSSALSRTWRTSPISRASSRPACDSPTPRSSGAGRERPAGRRPGPTPLPHEVPIRPEYGGPSDRLLPSPRPRRHAYHQGASPGLPDTQVLAIAYPEGRVPITDDRDVGELVFRHRQPHAGVIFLRLGNAQGTTVAGMRAADLG